MARIELKHSTIRFVDGHAAVGAANDMTMANGDTTITVDGFTGVVPNSARFTIVGSTRTYTVVSTVGSPTTQITFTPAFATADGIPVDNAVITVTGRTLEIKVGDGNLTYTKSKEYEYLLDRGELDTVKEGDHQPVQVSLDLVWEEIKSIGGDLTPTPEEVLDKVGAAADWVTSSADLCEPYAIDIEVEITKPCGGVQREIITLHDFRYEELEHDMDEATISCSGRCNITTPTIVRAL